MTFVPPVHLPAIVLMGVSGAGKSAVLKPVARIATVAEALHEIEAA